MSTLAEANRRYFDSMADSYDTKPWFARTNQQVSTFLRTHLSWLDIPLANTGSPTDVTEVRLLDYACGPGLITRSLGPYVTLTRGIDISPNMVSIFNERISSAGLSSSTAHAVQGNLFDKEDPSPKEFQAKEWHDFDIAAVGFGFHHFEDVVFAASQLKERLRPGGVLVISDFLEGADKWVDEEGREVEGNWNGKGHGHGHGHHHAHEHKHGHSHEHGSHDEIDTPEFRKKMNDSIVVYHFTIEGVKKFFSEAGFVDVDVVTLDERSYMEFAGDKLWRRILFAKGRKPFAEETKEQEKSEL